jgi:hypothetical protein
MHFDVLGKFMVRGSGFRLGEGFLGFVDMLFEVVVVDHGGMVSVSK